MKTSALLPWALAAAFVASPLACPAASAPDLEAGFRAPPDSAKPQTWWHWMNGNISKPGIRTDLEAMKEIGLGGATIVNVDSGIPRGPVSFMTPEWRDMFKFAIQEAGRLGLDMTVENCAGWSSSGGPWNTPEHGMQQLTSSELRVSGGQAFTGVLPRPPVNLDTYHDVAVLAFPAGAAGPAMRAAGPSAALADGAAAPALIDGNVQTALKLTAPSRTRPQSVQLSFAQPFAARTLKLVSGEGVPEWGGEVAVSEDGKSFRVVKTFTPNRRSPATRLISLGAEPVAARVWRVRLTAVSSRVRTPAISVAEVELLPQQTVDDFDAKAGISGQEVLSAHSDRSGSGGAIPRREIVDLTSRLSPDGTLNWQAPAGDWIVLRLGYTPIGVKNHPAPLEGTGLECDKFSKEALDAHWDGFMQKVLDDVGPLAGKTLTTSLIDSYEVGGQNWSKDFRAEFQRRRGYDLLTYLPAMTGRVVDDSGTTERFLWDVRRTIADLFAENYFGYFAELCCRHGLLNAVEPYTGPFESLQSGAPADVVMGEFWSGSSGHKSIKLASSIAHIYGKTIVGAESFTARPEAGRWQNDPYSLKALGDLMFCQGLNRYIFHRYAMQPWMDRFPGMTMGQWGFHFERTITWWKQGKGWIDYISRCEFLLQQGRAVADVAYFTGESAPVELRAGKPALPAGYDFDAVNADVLLHGATVKNGRLTLASGASYAALVLPPEDIDLTPAVAQKIAELIHDGATVVGPKPHHSPSLTDFPHCDQQVQRIVAEAWGNADGASVREHAYGKGRVVWGQSLEDVLGAQKLGPDFNFDASGGANLACCHRVAGDADIYFVSNQNHHADRVDVSFRTSGKVPQLWHADTGVMEPAPIWHEEPGRTNVRLTFDPAGSVFVIFRPAQGGEHLVAARDTFARARTPESPVTITRAVYIATDGAGQADVTTRVSAALANSRRGPIVNNASMGGDPAYLHVKELRIDYTRDGKPGHVVIPEGKIIEVPTADESIDVPTWTVETGAEPKVRAWQDGTVELQTAAGKTLRAVATGVPAPQPVSGPWTLSFPANWGAPASVTLDKLISWTDHAQPGVKYFSGTATYTRALDIPTDRLQPGREVWLDLGQVKNFAEVSLNGRDLGVLWKPPFRVNLTGIAKPGANQLVVKVTNLWPNRLIGDEQLPPDVEWNGKQLNGWPQWLLDGKPSPTGRLAFTTWHHWTKDMKPLDSGILGPVSLRTAVIVPAQ